MFFTGTTSFLQKKPWARVVYLYYISIINTYFRTINNRTTIFDLIYVCLK